MEQLKQAQSLALEEERAKIATLGAKAQEVESLTSQLVSLQSEKEETATKVSELEIEILELKEAQEVLEDERDQLKKIIQTLENSLSQAKNENSQAAEDRKATDKRHMAVVEDLEKKHAGELVEAAEEHAQVSGLLQVTQRSLEAANMELEKAKKTAGDAEEAHKLKLLEVEQAYMVVQNGLTERLASTSAELEVSSFIILLEAWSKCCILGSRGAI